MRRVGAAVLLGLVASMLALVPAPVAVAVADDGWTVTRVAGDDRYATAAALSRHTFRRRALHVVVASGEDYADALAATAAAARLDAPLLLTRRDSLPAATLAELRRLRPSLIYLAGGTGVVSGDVHRALAGVAAVRRVAGQDRFDTAAKLSSMAFGTGVPVVFLAQGRAFPDALAAGAVAGRMDGPVLLVESGEVPPAVAAELDRLRPARIVVVGGERAVGEPVVESLDHGNVDRVAGPDRYATASALAALAPQGAGVALVASGTSFPDALAAGPSASALGGTFAITTSGCLPTAAAQGMVDDGVRQVLVVGGAHVVSDAAAQSCRPVEARPRPASPSPEPDEEGGPVLTEHGTLDQDVADPAILRVGDRWFVYSTQVGLANVPVRTSTDLTVWSAPADAMPQLASWTAFGAHWAPSAVAAENGFVLWYSARHRPSGRQCISRAVADRPEGPFVDDLHIPPVCQLDLGGSIDPHVFTDDDGARWLSWKSDENVRGRPSRLWVAPLRADGRTLTGPASQLLVQGAPWETFTIEQPAITRHGETYYLFYSGGFWESDTYAIGYATAPSPRGPFTKRTAARPWWAGIEGAGGPGALDVFEGPDGESWATWHAWAGPIGYVHDDGRRALRVGPLRLP